MSNDHLSLHDCVRLSRFRFALHALLAVGFSLSTASADDQPLTLPEAVELASRQSPQVDAYRAARDGAQALVASSGRLPDPELIVGIDNLPVTGPDAGSLTDDFMTMRKVGVMQAIPRGEKRRLRTQLADDDVRLMQAEVSLAELDVKREAAQAWIAACVAAETARHLRSLEPEFELRSRVATSGVTSTADAFAARAAFAEFRDRLDDAEQTVRMTRAALARWIPQDASRPLAPLPGFTVLPIPADELSSNLHDHARILGYAAQLDAARSEIALAKAEKRPDWSVELAYAKRGPDFSDMVSLGFRVGLPLFPATRRDPQIAQKHARLTEIEARREAELRVHAAEIAAELANWRSLQTRVARYETELLPLTHARAQAALAAFESSQTNITPLLDARAAEVDAAVRLLELRAELGRSWAYLSYLRAPRSSP